MDTMNTFKKDEQMNTFTKDEQTILKNTSAKYKWIARDKNGELWVYKRKPKSSILFTVTMLQEVSALNHLKDFLRK